MDDNSSVLQDRIDELADRQTLQADNLKCFGPDCKNCSRFFYCPAHWGESDET